MTFEFTEHDYGILEQGADASYEFVYKNTGKVPLIITKVKSSCGCTTPTWSKEPLKRGKKEVLLVKYDSKRLGFINKSVTVYSNAENSPVVISIKGKIIQKKK